MKAGRAEVKIILSSIATSRLVWDTGNTIQKIIMMANTLVELYNQKNRNKKIDIKLHLWWTVYLLFPRVYLTNHTRIEWFKIVVVRLGGWLSG